PPEQLFLALVGGYLLGVNSERKLVMELQCNLALRWFVGLNLDQDAWDASTFSQNRRRRFDESGVLEKVFDATIKQAMAAGLVSHHVSADGTLVRANASYKSLEYHLHLLSVLSIISIDSLGSEGLVFPSVSGFD